MLFITYSNLWSVSVFLPLTYIIFIFSTLLYCLPTLKNQTYFTATKTKSLFSKLNTFDILPLVYSPLLILLLILFLWASPATSAWFGHIVFTNYQLKMFYMVLGFFMFVLYVLLTTMYFSSREVYDYFIVLYNFFYWVVLLFAANTIFTVIFIIEVISAIIFLLIVTSTFTSNYFYRNVDLSFGNLFQNSTPYTFLQSLIYYFWISLISALNLFLFILLLYIKLHTLDWFTLEHVFQYLTSVSSFKDLISIGCAWLVFLLSIFIKSGIAPLYLYKPTFFKGLPFYTLSFYICFFYFFFFLFTIHLLNSYFTELFYFYSFALTLLVVLGLFTLFFIICDSYYLKVFLAISSILNSLFVFLALTTLHSSSMTFWL
jgi:hypothetical protein